MTPTSETQPTPGQVIVSKSNDGWCGVPCPDCSGSGRRWSEDGEYEFSCGRCGGTGERYESHLDLRSEEQS